MTTAPPTPATTDTESPALVRWFGIAGIAYVLLVLGAYFQTQGASPDTILDYVPWLEDADELDDFKLFARAWIPGLIVFLAFATGYLRRHGRAEPALSQLGSLLAVTAGVVGLVGASTFSTPGLRDAFDSAHGNPAVTDPEVANALDILGSHLFYNAWITIIGAWVLVAVHIARRQMPRAITGLGYFAGGIALLAMVPPFAWLGMPLHMLWMLVVAVRSLVRPAPTV